MDVLAGAGRISIAELRKALRRLGVRRQLSDDEIGRILRQSDKDGDGYVTLDEFEASPRLRSSCPTAGSR
jgi:Ca2+-binding EF-hand superfamily protein